MCSWGWQFGHISFELQQHWEAVKSLTYHIQIQHSKCSEEEH
jgi:hypothetical protein